MSREILRRGTVCKRFHAAYFVQDSQLGACYLCYACWKARQPKMDIQSQDHKQQTDKEQGLHLQVNWNLDGTKVSAHLDQLECMF